MHAVFAAESDMDYDQIAEDVWNADATTTASATSTLGNKDRLKLPRVRMVEIGLVGMALVLWAGKLLIERLLYRYMIFAIYFALDKTNESYRCNCPVFSPLGKDSHASSVPTGL